jgi:hypothetical protein
MIVTSHTNQRKNNTSNFPIARLHVPDYWVVSYKLSQAKMHGINIYGMHDCFQVDRSTLLEPWDQLTRTRSTSRKKLYLSIAKQPSFGSEKDRADWVPNQVVHLVLCLVGVGGEGETLSAMDATALAQAMSSLFIRSSSPQITGTSGDRAYSPGP